MKTPVALLLLTTCFLAACQKESILGTKPYKEPSQPSLTTGNSTTSSSKDPKKNPGPVSQGGTTVYDTIPDMAVLKLKLVKDSINYDETMFVFDHTSSLAYDQNNDGLYMSGFGLESLASLSSDGRDLVINRLPYSRGMSVGLDVDAKTDGAFALQVSYLKDIPADIQVVIRDNYAKDSLDVRTGAYKFNIVKSDAGTYGTNRFSVVFRNKAR